MCTYFIRFSCCNQVIVIHHQPWRIKLWNVYSSIVDTNLPRISRQIHTWIAPSQTCIMEICLWLNSRKKMTSGRMYHMNPHQLFFSTFVNPKFNFTPIIWLYAQNLEIVVFLSLNQSTLTIFDNIIDLTLVIDWFIHQYLSLADWLHKNDLFMSCNTSNIQKSTKRENFFAYVFSISVRMTFTQKIMHKNMHFLTGHLDPTSECSQYLLVARCLGISIKTTRFVTVLYQ